MHEPSEHLNGLPDSSPDDVQVLMEGAVATVTLNRPEVLNALTPGMLRRYCAALAELDADPAVRVIVVTGAGRAFCAGADLTQDGESFAGAVRAGLARAPAGGGFDGPLHLHTPVLAALNGVSAGMGTAYALMADVRFAAASARIGTTFARLGLVAEWGMAHTLTAAVGQAAATELLLSGRYVDAPEALAIGLVSKVLPDPELLPTAQAWAAAIAQGTSPRSHATVKEQLRRVAAGESLEAGFDRSLEDMLASLESPDVRGAIAAFRRKEPPRFPDYDDR
jgi:enoyl-CoA hydratase/carnithine racemase